MSLDSKTFFEVLKKQELVTKKQLAALQNGIKKESLSQSDLETLVTKKYLTRWQASRLLSGKHHLRVGDYRLLDFLGQDRVGEVYLVRSSASNSVQRLRLVSKDFCEDQNQLQSYLDCVRSYQKIKSEGLIRVLNVAQAGKRYIVVSEYTPGKTLAQACEGKPQSITVVEKLVNQLTSVLSDLKAKNLRHSSLNGNAIIWLDEQNWKLDLPAEIGYLGTTPQAVETVQDSDAAGLATVAAKCLVGKFGGQDFTGSELAQRLVSMASDSNLTTTQVNQAFKMDTSTQADVSVPVILAEDDVSFDQSELPEVIPTTVDTLTAIEPQEDVFGNFDKIEVASELQVMAPQVTRVPMIVEESASEIKKQRKESRDAVDQPGEVAAVSGNKVLLFASLGGAVGVVVLGLLIYFLIGGNQSGKNQQVAVNRSALENAESKVPNSATDQTSASTPKKKKQEDKEPQELVGLKKKELKTSGSGIFQGIGAINQDNKDPANPGNETDQSSKGLPEKKPTGPIAGEPKKEQKTDKNESPKSDKNKDVGTGNNGPSNPDDDGPAKPPEPNGKSNPGPEKKGPVKKGPDNPAVPDTESKEKGKEEPAKDDSVLLIGQRKKAKDDAKKEPSGTSRFANPFLKAPDFVDLKLPKKGEDVTALQTLFPLAVPGSAPLIVTLHGGEHASKSKNQFVLKASTSQNATWSVNAGAKPPFKPIGQFKFDGKNFVFAWDSFAEDFSNSSSLVNCALKIQAANYKHTVALRAPQVTPAMEFVKSFSPKSDTSVSHLPDMQYVKIQLVNVPKGFPKFEYPKDKNLLVGQADQVYVAFKKENIDIFRGNFVSRVRGGSKVSVNFDLSYVTPDKKLQKISSMQKFQGEAEKLVNDTAILQQRVKLINEQYSKLKDANQKSQFTRLTNRTKLQEQLTLYQLQSTHIQAIKEMLEAIAREKLQYRIYYQAGEVEVDLATPTGKKYIDPPTPEQVKKTP